MCLASVSCRVGCRLTQTKSTIAVYEDLVGQQIPDSLVMEGHQSLEEDDIGRPHVGGLLHPGMLDEGILRDFYAIAAFYKVDEGLIGEIEVEGIGVVEVILSDVDLSLIDV